MQDIKDFNNFSSIKDNVLLIYCEIKRVTHKATLNKTSKYIDYTNKVIRKIVNNALKQIRFLFKKCLYKRIQLI